MPNTTRRRSARDPLDHDPVALRTRRVELGRALSDVATDAEISKGHLSELERGTRNPSPAVLKRLAGVLGCETTDLMPKRPAVA